MTARVAAAALALLLGACGGAGSQSQIGVVIAVDGDLTHVASFTLRTPAGEDLVLVPAPDARFDGAPLSHLIEHLRSGEPVRVVYRTEDDRLVATRLGDA